MRGRRWLLIWSAGLGACLLSGCLRGLLPPDKSGARSDSPVPVAKAADDGAKRTDLSPTKSPTDYQVCQPPPANPDAEPAPAPVNTVDLRIQPRQAPPAQPTDPPGPQMPVRSSAAAKPDAASVQVLRALLEGRPDDEVREHLKHYDPVTHEALLALLGGVAQLEVGGGVAQTSPRELAALVDRLTGATIALRSQAQLTLDNMCFCSHIENFGQFRTLLPEHSSFQPGEEARVYVQVRNFASRRERGGYATVLKGRLEIYEEGNRDKPFIIWDSEPCADFSWTLRQDYFVNFRFRVPQNCPPGSYTVWISVEDWTDTAAGTKRVARSRSARSSLDFRVGTPIRQPRADIADVTPTN